MENENIPGENTPKKNIWKDLYTYLHDLIYSLVGVVVLFVFILRIVVVSGPSMLPTLVDHDYVALLSNVFYHGDDIQNGDVVVTLAPKYDEEPLVKRVIATEGQTVDIDFQEGVVYVDGVALDEPYTYEPTYNQFYDQGVRFPLTVEEDHVFVLGDNRNNSSDSRHIRIGQIDTRYVLGKVLWVVLPGTDARYDVERDFGRIGGVS